MILSDIPQGLSPLTPTQIHQVKDLLGSMTPIQQAWISGYMAAAANAATPIALQETVSVDASPLTILYGSQTGNAKGIAEEMASKAKARGLDVKLANMADYKPNQLKNEKFLTIVISTYGEGEPPEQAEKLYNFLSSKKAPKLDGVQVAVIGLGDSSYEFFCKTASDFEERLSALGATVITERALLDVDYDEAAAAWVDGAVDLFEPELKALNGAASPAVNGLAGFSGAPQVAESIYNKKNPFTAEVGEVQKITGRDSLKDVRHVEISLEGSGLQYQSGDSLGVYFLNDSLVVDEVLALLKIDADEAVRIGDDSKSVRDALIEDFELTQSYPGFVEKYAAATGNTELAEIASDKAGLRDYLSDRQIYDVIRQNPGELTAQALIESLRKQQPRLYSIASSQKEVEEEVHLTIAVVEYDTHENNHLGGCSGFLGRRVEDGDKVRVYVEHNDSFRLPENPEAPVIMIGPGTGIAPFRSFLQDREADGVEGNSWLFFGNPHFTQDFLYQVELQSYLKSGVLSKLSVAFSRDQAQKIYVQDRIVENGAELFEWLEKGAHLYICGDGNHMAKDVHQALLSVVETHGGRSAEEAEAYVEALRDDKRYQKDVY
ncbi:assimilatory sulfite reductase (NADPH) flavoprotein subunit [Granulosicoccus antarcticus]|uniref:Sulfite reductase [NADPH] flavoprotein alpha-component n=1 Tax=Granulosicoccus antarcticus IMCC3135 TaxID=1192854 RepID=A0A2Z2NWJ5_9GAMM|nr:assimilatory sulfite reductase (NADPH) flavoprotein subunit [Granulosicoccus antarcticus]ASJ75836.1 Sulfite reductase [NADPH] flavoprotein alpha-component [Granulosicoccus antarcticus IMCC3135]